MSGGITIENRYENPYISTIRAIGDVIQMYSTDRQFPVYGFGGKVFGSGTTVSHCFPLTSKLYIYTIIFI